MRMNIMMKRFLAASGIIAILLLILACESKIVSPPQNDPMLSISINLSDASPKLLAAVNQYQVIVVDPAASETLAVSPLTLNSSGNITGQFDNLPTGIVLEFTAQAIDAQLGLIFSGTTNAILEPGVNNNVFINLSPVVPLMKFTPRRTEIVGTDTSSHSFDIKIFNVDSLYGVSFRVRYDSNYFRAVNATLDSSQNASSVIFFQFDSSDVVGPYKAITVTGIDPANGIVDANGDGVLANVRFVLAKPFALADSTFLQLEPTGMTRQDGSNIPIGNLYRDDAFVRITP